MSKIINTLFISIFSLSLLISCKSSSTSVEAVGGNNGDNYTLKIATLLYDELKGVGSGNNADDLVSISVGVGDSPATARAMSVLNNGILVPKDSSVYIKVEPKGAEITPDESEDTEGEDTASSINVMWLGYGFDYEEDMVSTEIEIAITRNTTLTLITPGNNTVKIVPITLSLNVKGEGLGGKVILNDNNDIPYGEGSHTIQFVKGLGITKLEAIVPDTNEVADIVFSGFDIQYVGIVTNNPYELDIKEDTVVVANFYDKSAATANITITSDNGSSIYVNDELKVFDANTSSFVMANQPVGSTIEIEMETPPSDMTFISWSDDVSGHLGTERKLVYTVTSDAEIKPIFSQSEGVVTVVINPNTNFYTDTTLHDRNRVDYIVYGSDGSSIIRASQNSGVELQTYEDSLYPKSGNNTVSFDAGNTIEFIAHAGEGFYPNDPNRIKWSGAATGTGTNKKVKFSSSTSTSLTLTFERETRSVKVDIKRLKLDNTGESEETDKENAKGYKVKLEYDGKTEETDYKSIPWHTKVKVIIEPGIHYNAKYIYNGPLHNDKNQTINPEEDYSSATGWKEYTLSYDLENNVTNAVGIIHNNVTMTNIIKGGNFTGGVSPDELNKYKASVSIAKTGISTSDKTISATSYFNGTNSVDEDNTNYFKVLSGIPIEVTANTTSASLFASHDITGNVKFTNSSYTNSKASIIGTGGGGFSITTTFVSPIYTLTVKPRAFTNETATATEADDLKATPYTFTVTPTKGTTEYDSETKFALTNGIPVKLTGLPNIDYSVLRVGGDKVASKDITITNNASTNVDFLHKMVKNQLIIVGGKDDKHTSYVNVSGTGLTSETKKYSAQFRNMIYNPDSADQKVLHDIAPTATNEFYVLSGITNKLKFSITTSEVHNYDKIRSENVSDSIRAIEFTGTTTGGIRTYNSTRDVTATKTLSVDGGRIIVEFRINSFAGYLSGGSGQMAPSVEKYPNDYVAKPSNNIYTIYDAYDLYKLSTDQNLIDTDYKNVTIILNNDIYIYGYDLFNSGNPPVILEGIKTKSGFKGTFNGNNYVIYDPYTSKWFIDKVVGGVVTGLTIARGELGVGGGGINYGLIGSVNQARLAYITNAARNTANKVTRNAGGIIGNYDGESSLSYLVNYSTVHGMNNVGGIIGLHSDNIGQDNYYFANYGEVNGDSYVGGIIGHGYGQYDSTKKHSYVFNKGNVNGASYVGGIIGLADWGALEIHNFYNTGKVSGTTSGGIAGLIRGYRKKNGGGQKDTDKTTYSLYNGYNIGRVEGDENAAIVSRAGYEADSGEHYINMNNVYSERSLAGGNRYIYSGVPNLWNEDGGTFSDTFNDSKYTLFITGRGSASGSHPDALHNNVSITAAQLAAAVTDLTGFKDNNNIWVQSNPANINGYTSRPTFVDFPESPKPTLDK